MPGIEISYASLSVESVNSQVENRDARKVAGICVRKRCGKAAADDSLFCDEHAKAQREYNAAYMARKRAKWETEKRCTNCGAVERKRGSKWCPACWIRDERIQKSSVNPQVENRGDRIAARLIPWENSPTNANRIRMRGGKRGARPRSETDDQDLIDVDKLLANGRAGLELLKELENSGVAKTEKRRTELYTLDYFAGAARFLRDLLTRRRYDIDILAKPIPDEDE